MTPEYLAGFFDGEGCMTYHVGHSGRIRARVSISQKGRGILDDIQEYLGFGSVVRSGDCHMWRAGKQHEVRRFIQIVYPHAIVKKEQLKLGYRLAGLSGSRDKHLKRLLVVKMSKLKVA